MKRIKRFSVVQTAKVAAVIYFFIIALFMIPIGLISTIFGGDTFQEMPYFNSTFFFFIPFLYAIIAFIFTAIGCLVYNLIAKWVGGIEVEIETANEMVDYE